MRLRDNFSLYPVALVAATLETFILYIYWNGRTGSFLHMETDNFLLASHLYLLLACLVAYLTALALIRPFESILEGIVLYANGKLDHRIRRSKIKELDQLAEHLNNMAGKLTELDRMKNDFIANASHELRSPLAAMEGYVSLMLEQGNIVDRDRENLIRVNSNLARLRRLVENLLDVAQIEARRIPIKPESCDLNAIAQDVCALFSLQIKERHLALVVAMDSRLPTADADPARVRQILTNLLDNAVKYNRQGGTLSVRSSMEGNRVALSVEDSGAGMPAESLDSLFQRFRRLPAPSPEVAKVKGVGLGLAISHGLALAMGGDLKARSKLGVGSTFTLYLPQLGSDRT